MSEVYLPEKSLEEMYYAASFVAYNSTHLLFCFKEGFQNWRVYLERVMKVEEVGMQIS